MEGMSMRLHLLVYPLMLRPTTAEPTDLSITMDDRLLEGRKRLERMTEHPPLDVLCCTERL